MANACSWDMQLSTYHVSRKFDVQAPYARVLCGVLEVCTVWVVKFEQHVGVAIVLKFHELHGL